MNVIVGIPANCSKCCVIAALIASCTLMTSSRGLAQAREPDPKGVAADIVQRFCDYVNAGLPQLASGLLATEWTFQERKYDPRQEVAAFLSNTGAGADLPGLLIAKRRIVQVDDHTVEFRCVAIWTLTDSKGRSHRICTNEAFVIEVRSGKGEIAAARSLPVIAREFRRPAQLSRELELLR